MIYHSINASWIPLEDKIDCSNKWKIKSNDIDQKAMKALFKKILREYNIRPSLLKVREGETGLMEIKYLANTNSGLELTYNPVALSFYDLKEIESYLHHEAYHPLTQTGGPVSVPNMSPEVVDYLVHFTVCYEEYINYMSQPEYYRSNQPFLRAKIKELYWYYFNICTVKHIALNNLTSEPTFITLFTTLNDVLADGMYFMIYSVNLIEAWAKKYQLDAILKYYEWILEDFRIIHHSNYPQSEAFRLAQLSGRLAVAIDLAKLSVENTIAFTPPTFDYYQQHYVETINDANSVGLKIAQSWIDRLNSLSK